MIDEVAVYDTALDEKEIQSVMNGLAEKFKFVVDSGGNWQQSGPQSKGLHPKLAQVGASLTANTTKVMHSL